MASNDPLFGNYTITATGDWEQLPARSGQTGGISLRVRAGGASVQFAKSNAPAATDLAQLDPGDGVDLAIMSINKIFVKGTIGTVIDYFGVSAY